MPARHWSATASASSASLRGRGAPAARQASSSTSGKRCTAVACRRAQPWMFMGEKVNAAAARNAAGPSPVQCRTSAKVTTAVTSTVIRTVTL